MFEILFSRASAVKRHSSAPLATERAAFLKDLADRGIAVSTLRRCAFYCRWIAERIRKRPRADRFGEEDIAVLWKSWVLRRAVRRRRAVLQPSPKESFRAVARGFLGSLGRLASMPEKPPGPYEDRVQEFLVVQRDELGLSPTTCTFRSKQVRRFLVHLCEQSCSMESIRPPHLDSYFQKLASTWSRVSLRSAAVALRAWLRFCERRGYIRSGLSNAVLIPRVYRHEGLPIAPTWEQVSRIIPESEEERPAHLRARAVLLLLAVYGLRASEVRCLRLDNIEWKHDRIHIVRPKTGRQEQYPLHPIVGNAIAHYLQSGRPRSDSRVLFLTLQAPHRPLSPGALASIVRERLSGVMSSGRNQGPHALRHACARRLLDTGLSLKEIGDHLGHRSAEATRVYTKVDLNALRLVVLEDLGGIL